MNILKVFNIPLVRHLIAGTGIIVAIYYLAINPLQQQNKEIREDYNNLVNTQSEIINYLAKKDTYHIENKVDVKKQKQGSNINLIPDNKMTVSNTTSADSIVVKKRTWAGRQLKKIGDWFR